MDTKVNDFVRDVLKRTGLSPGLAAVVVANLPTASIVELAVCDIRCFEQWLKAMMIPGSDILAASNLPFPDFQRRQQTNQYYDQAPGGERRHLQPQPIVNAPLTQFNNSGERFQPHYQRMSTPSPSGYISSGERSQQQRMSSPSTSGYISSGERRRHHQQLLSSPSPSSYISSGERRRHHQQRMPTPSPSPTGFLSNMDTGNESFISQAPARQHRLSTQLPRPTFCESGNSELESPRPPRPAATSLRRRAHRQRSPPRRVDEMTVNTEQELNVLQTDESSLFDMLPAVDNEDQTVDLSMLMGDDGDDITATTGFTDMMLSATTGEEPCMLCSSIAECRGFKIRNQSPVVKMKACGACVASHHITVCRPPGNRLVGSTPNALIAIPGNALGVPIVFTATGRTVNRNFCMPGRNWKRIRVKNVLTGLWEMLDSLPNGALAAGNQNR